jgi:hypothetical protein
MFSNTFLAKKCNIRITQNSRGFLPPTFFVNTLKPVYAHLETAYNSAFNYTFFDVLMGKLIFWGHFGIFCKF